jgi:lambda repressor-like predicted transcriptional regulator
VKAQAPAVAPRRVFRRDRLLELKAAAKSWEALSRELGVLVGTLRNALPKGSPKTAAVSA